MQRSPFIDVVVRSCVRVRRNLAFRPPEARPFGIGDRDRLGRTNRRLADWFGPQSHLPRSDVISRSDVFGGTPKTAGATPAIPEEEHCANEPFGFLHGAVRATAALCLLVASFSASAAVREVGAIEPTVNDLNRELAFFTNTLPFRLFSEITTARGVADDLLALHDTHLRTAELQLGSERIRLTAHLRYKGRTIPADSRSFDHWFQHIAIVVSDMDAAYEHLRRAKVKHVSTGPQTLPAWNKDAGGIKAFYFRDPEDHVLEVIWFPSGKGDPKWQRAASVPLARESGIRQEDAGGTLFLGINHTANGERAGV